MEARCRVLFLVLVLLVVASAAVLVVEDRAQRRPVQDQAFQHLVGGLGFGPAVDLSDGPFDFDPRLDGTPGADTGPVPGGGCFCPRYGGGLFFYRPLPQGVPLRLADEGDVQNP